MVLLLPPTRPELMASLRFPAIMAPFLLLFIRYRFLWSYVAAGSTKAGDAWRLSGCLTAIFVFVAYPITLSKYDAWLWTMHPWLVALFVLFWFSLAGWTLFRHFVMQNMANEKLQKDLAWISRGSPLSADPVSPIWLRTWGWANCFGLILLVVGAGMVVDSLK
jgi:hypothetical protein